jgi:hypothetical protein
MKKKSNNFQFTGALLLTRSQMKKVMGGNNSELEVEGGSSGSCWGICISEGLPCPGSIIKPPAAEICSPRYPKCCS